MSLSQLLPFVECPVIVLRNRDIMLLLLMWDDCQYPVAEPAAHFIGRQVAQITDALFTTVIMHKSSPFVLKRS